MYLTSAALVLFFKCISFYKTNLVSRLLEGYVNNPKLNLQKKNAHNVTGVIIHEFINMCQETSVFI